MENNGVNPNTGSKGVFPGSQALQNQPNRPVSKPQTVAESMQDNPYEELNLQQPMQQQPMQQQPMTHVAEQPVASEDTDTYLKLDITNPEGQVSGILEIDLISFRERGMESRYLSINAVGSGQDGNQSQTTIAIQSEEDFKRFKAFISRLNWND